MTWLPGTLQSKRRHKLAMAIARDTIEAFGPLAEGHLLSLMRERPSLLCYRMLLARAIHDVRKLRRLQVAATQWAPQLRGS